MARNITFKIITEAQTKALEGLNRDLKEVKKNLDALTKGQKRTLDKALGLDAAADDAKSAIKHLRGVVDEIKEMGNEAATAKRKLNTLSQEEKDLAQAANRLERATQKKPEPLKKNDDALKKLSGTTKNYRRDMDGLGKAMRDNKSALGDVEDALTKQLSGALKNGARDVGTVLTELRLLRAEAGKVDRAVEGMKILPDDLASAQKKLAQATNDLSEAQSKLYAVRNKPDRSVEEIEDAQRALERSNATYEEAVRDVDKLNTKFEQFGATINEAERRIVKIRNAISRNKLEEFIPASAMRNLETVDDALVTASRAVDKFGTTAVQGLRAVQTELGQLAGRRTQLKSISDDLEKMRKEMIALGNLEIDFIKQDMRGMSSAVRSATNDLRNQNKVTIDHLADINRLTQATNTFGLAQRQAAQYAQSGAYNIREQQKVNQLYAESLAEVRTIQTSMNSREKQLLKTKKDLADAQLELNNRIRAGEQNLARFSDQSSADYKRAKRELDNLNEAYDVNNKAIIENQNNLRRNEDALRSVGNTFDLIRRDQEGFLGIMDRVKVAYQEQERAAKSAADEQRRLSREQERDQQRMLRDQTNAINRMGSVAKIGAFFGASGTGGLPSNSINIFREMSTVIQQINRVALQLSNTLGNVLRSAISAAANAARGFISSAGSMFAGLQRSLQSISSAFVNFGNRVQRSMQQARASMLEFYAAGYSLLTVGSQIQQFGNMMFRQMGMGLESFMDYERARTQAGVAGAQAVRADGSIIPETSTELPDRYAVNSKIIDQIVFDLQRGVATPEWLGGGTGQPLPVQFDAKELAQGLYYYSSAIGAPITEQNQRQVSDAVATIMQMASVTNTGIETATKGVLNVMMEFGYDPRAIGSESQEVREEAARRTAQTAAQMGYLANISSMEVSDIVETFKMVGPQAHLLSPGALEGQEGAGLNETFMLAFLASEVGLRGGNVGRGINQAFTSLLDPTDKMLEVTGKYWGEGGEPLTEEQFNEIFKDNGALRGGISGFLRELSGSVNRTDLTTMLAELFTSNATRALTGPVVMSDDFDMETWLTRIEQNPLKWLESAVAESANTISGWFTYMKNSFFQFQKSIIDSVRGPLMNAFRMVGGILFDFAEEIQLDPAIGKTIAGIVTAIASLATIGGTIAIAAGGILLMSRAFAMLGGMTGSIIRMVAMASVTLLGLIPLLLGIGVAIAAVRALWQSNFLGMREAFENFRGSMTIEEFTDSFVKGFINMFKVISTAVDEFTRGILGGQGSTNNLFALMQSIFGPLLGGQIIQGLANLRNALDPTRESVRQFFDGVGEGSATLQDVGLAIQGFFEQIFLGQQRAETVSAQNAIGKVLGIENLSGILHGASQHISAFVGSVIGYAQQIGNIWLDMVDNIRGNIVRALGGTDVSSFFMSLGQVAAGVAQGIVIAFTAIFGTIELVTDKVADLSESLQDAGGAGKEILGFTLTFDRALQALGITIGLVLGARLALAFGPFMGIVTRLVPIITSMSAVIVGIGGRMVVLAANIAVTTAAWLAQLAVMGAVLLIKNALNIMNWLLAASSAAVAVAQGAQVASGTANLGVMSLLSGIATLLSGAYTAVAFAAGAAATGTLTFTMVVAAAVAVVVALVAVVVTLIAVFAAIAAAAFAIAGIMLIVVAATDGLGAALSAARDFAIGFWAGLQPGFNVVQAFAELVMTVTDFIGKITGLGSGFQVLGMIAGAAISGIMIVLVALTVAVIALTAAIIAAGVATLASMLAPLAPAALFAAAIIGLIQLVRNFGDVWDWFTEKMSGVGSAVLDGWLMMTDGMELAFTQSLDAIIGKVIDFVNWLGSGVPGFAKGRLGIPEDIGELEGLNLSEGVEKRIAARETERTINNAISVVKRGTSAYADAVGGMEEQSNKLMDALRVIGLDDEVRELGLKYDIDVDQAGFDDLTSLFGELTKMPEMEQMLADTDFDYSVLGPSGESYQVAKSAWDDYQNRIKLMSESLGITAEEATRRVNDSYAAMGMAIPVDPGSFADWTTQMDGIGDSAEENAERFVASVEDMQKALSDFYGNMTLEQSMDLFKNLEGMGNKETIGSTLMAVGDKILENAGDVPWLNMTELLMDATGGTAGSINTEMVGQNIHKNLRPVLEHTARQLGTTVDELLADVPKFMAPEGLVNLATGEFVRILDSMPTDLYSKLDTLGIQQGWNEFGLDWSELMIYGTGMAMQGLDWNLADYIAESYGVEVEAAEAALREAGIDPNVISDGWFEATEQAALTMDGQIQVITAEMADMATQLVNSADGMFIRLTESELRNLPEAVKIYLDSLGYTFVTDDTSSNITAWADGVVSAATEAAKRIEEAMSFTTAERDRTDPRYGLWFDGGNGGGLDSYMDRRVGDYQSYLDNLQNIGWGSAGQGAPTATQKNVITQEVQIKYVYEDAEITKQNTRNAISGGQISAQGDPQITVKAKIEPDLAEFTSWMGTISTQYSDVGIKVKIEPDLVEFMSWMGTISTHFGNVGVKVKITPDLTEFMSWMNTIQTHYNDIGIKVKVKPDLTEFSTGLNTLNVLVDSGEIGAFKIPVTPDFTSFSEELASLANLDTSSVKIKIEANTQPLATTLGNLFMNEFATLKIKVDIEEPDLSFLNNLPGAPMGKTPSATITINVVGADTAKTAIDGVVASATAMAVGWTASIMQIGAQGAQSNIDSARTAAQQFAVGWTASIMETGSAFAKDKINGVRDAALDMAGSYTVTVDIVVNGLGTLNSAINSIANLPTTRTSTVNIVTNNVRNNITNNVGPNVATGGMIGSAAMLGRSHDASAIVPRASGGMIGAGEYTLVGELGPELVKLPTGSWVHTARQTSRMFRDQLQVQRHYSAQKVPYQRAPSMAPQASYSPPTFGRNESALSTSASGGGTVNNFHFHGDITIGDKKAGEDFFAEIDRRAGRRTSLATRGMYPTDDTKPWT